MIVVSNTSPITNLAAIDQLELLHHVYQTILIPQAVYIDRAGFHINQQLYSTILVSANES
jgi:predicted nucleic acid-binding protein